MPEEEGERKEAPAPPPAPTPPAELLAELMAEALANSFNENSAITEQLLESLRAKPSGSGSEDVVGIHTVFSRMLSDLSGASKAEASGASKAEATTTAEVGEKDGGGIQKKGRWDEEEENDIAMAINVCGGTGDWTKIYNHLRDTGCKVAVRGKTNISRHWCYIKDEYPVIDGKIIIPATAGRTKQLRKRSEKLVVKRRQKKPPPPLAPPEQPRQPPPEQPLQPPPDQPLPLQPPPEQPLPLQPPPEQPLQPPPKQPLQSPPEQPEQPLPLQPPPEQPLQHPPEHPLPLQPPPEQLLQPPPKQPLQPPPKQSLQSPPEQPEQPLQVPLPRQQPPQHSARDAFLQAAALTLVRHEDYMKEMVRNIFEEMWKEKMGGQ